jgi:tryptophan 7-halogenase
MSIRKGVNVLNAEPVTIVIAGGGTAGWMTAAALSRFLETGYRIQLVESEEIGTVGVGEATIPQISLFNTALGIDENAFLRATQGTFKLGIEFVDWNKLGSRYMHAFGTVGRDVGMVPFQHYWHRARQSGVAKELGAYSLNNSAALAGKMQHGPARTAQSLPVMPYAYHFDAGLYAGFLRRYAEVRSVLRTEGRIARVELETGTGSVTALVLDTGERITGDLFIDCTGFKGLLIEDALKTGYDDWSHWLPCDRAMAVPSENISPPMPYTRSTALAAGWQWRIPLQHRTGNGYVYCSSYISDDDACSALLANLEGKALIDPRPLKFVTGKRKRIWNKNVVAIGLASGFMEPLESTSIHLIQSAISRLLKMMPGKRISIADSTEFNRQSDFEYERIRDFLILHYKATERNDTAFWRYCRDMEIPDTLSAKLELFKENGHIFREHEELFTEAGWFQVMAGQGIVPSGQHALACHISTDDLAEYMATLEALTRRETVQMSSHAGYIMKNCAATSEARTAA